MTDNNWISVKNQTPPFKQALLIVYKGYVQEISWEYVGLENKTHTFKPYFFGVQDTGMMMFGDVTHYRLISNIEPPEDI